MKANLLISASTFVAATLITANSICSAREPIVVPSPAVASSNVLTIEEESIPAADVTETNQLPRIRDIFVGGALAYLSGTNDARAEDVSVVALSDDELFIQVNDSGRNVPRFIVESHYLGGKDIYSSERSGNVGSQSLRAIGAVAQCGPFAFVPESVSYGCGPFIAGVTGEEIIDQVGLGWMIGIGAKRESTTDKYVGTGFTLGLGVMFNGNAKVIDERVVDISTGRVREDFIEQVRNNSGIVQIEDEDVSVFISFGVGKQITSPGQPRGANPEDAQK